MNQWQRNSALKKAAQLTDLHDRLVDLGVLVRVVKQDVSSGVTVKDGRPPVTLVKEKRFGGMYDTLTRKFCGESKDPLVWYVSEEQYPLITHDHGASRILCFGAEGSGKSHTLGMYLALKVIEFAEMDYRGNAGCTAPTGDRLRTLLHVMKSVFPLQTPHQKAPGAWCTWHNFGGPGELRFITGLTVQMRSTHQSSSALGSPIQGSNWAFCISDEIQDQIEEGDRDGDIEARLRAAPNGRSYRFCTATAKDSSNFRNWRALKDQSIDWTIQRMPYTANWSVWPQHWETMKRNLSKREWQRRCLALDVAPENAVYHAWDRKKNLISLPEIGAFDVTKRVLKRFGNFSCLVGHDPGLTVDCSVILKAYQMPKERTHRWFVVDEVTTKGTTEEHVSQLLKRLQDHWGINHYGPEEDKALVRCDPYGDSSNKTDKSVYLQFKLFGLEIRSAQYSKTGKGTGHIGREARIEMVNRLLCNASGESRLFIAKNKNGTPSAPRLVEALEEMERDASGRAEAEKKGTKRDRTHWPAALGYALWPTEKIHRVTPEKRKIEQQWV